MEVLRLLLLLLATIGSCCERLRFQRLLGDLRRRDSFVVVVILCDLLSFGNLKPVFNNSKLAEEDRSPALYPTTKVGISLHDGIVFDNKH